MKMILLLVLAIAGCNNPAGVIPPAVENAIPARYDINDPMFARAKEELLAEVEACGPGVVKGATGENRCTHQIVVDQLFLTHPADKTGLLHDPDWAFKDSVKFVAPRPATIPDSFDLRDFMKGGQPVIKEQQCGDCWAWASHHGYELVQAIHDGKAIDDSVQTVLSCSGEGTCGGGYMSAVDFIKKGLPLEGAFPYLNGVTGKCKFSSTELAKGWEPKMLDTPYIGSSLQYSRALKTASGFTAHASVTEMQEAMLQWKAPLVVTVMAYSASGDGVVSSCSSINSGGNHMVTIVGWDKEGGSYNAHVWNSWGPTHGKGGVSRIKWECGPGQLNRGLGVAAKVVQYKPACTPADATIGKAKYIVLQGSSVRLGNRVPGQKCKWTPSQGLSDPNSCETYASPDISTEYHLSASNDCGSSSAMSLVEVWGPKGQVPGGIRTPLGVLQ